MANSVTRRPFLVIFGMGVIILIAIILALFRPWHTPSVTALPVVRVAYLPIYVDLPLFVAQERGFFTKHGVKVEMLRFETSADMGSALVGERADAAASIATNSALAIETRDPSRFRIFLVDAETKENPLSALLVSSKSKLQSVKELNGRTIGSFPGPTAQIFAPLALENLGLPKGSYQLQELPVGSHITALESGRIDAVVTYEPTATQAVMRYGSRRLVPALIESNVMSPWQAGVWILGTDFANQHGDTAQRFVRAIYDAVEFIESQPIEAKSALRGYTSIENEVAVKTPDIPFTTVDKADLVALQRQADMLAQHGTLSRQVDIAGLMMTVLPEHK